MRWAIACLFLASCVSMPVKPPVSPCSGLVPDCHSSYAGIPAAKTVQRALQSQTLIGGKPAEPADWPASVYARAGNAACSATVVGERVLFMASHCMVDGGIVSFSAHANSYTARCAHHPDYAKNPTADWALCLVDRPVTGIPFEVLGIHESLGVGDHVTMSGYGCVKPGGGGGNDGIFRVGDAIIQGMPEGVTYDIVTKGGAALCFGDSGGSAYHVHGDGARYIIGVNSRGDIDTMSYLPGVFAPAFYNWARAWASVSNNVDICGIHASAEGCRTSDLADGKFEFDSPAACIKGLVKPNYLGKKSEILIKIQNAIGGKP